ERNERPHHHVLGFNCSFPDNRLVGTRPNGDELYESNILNSLWTDNDGEPLGIINFGIATPGRAAHYIAKYTSKNWNIDLVDQDGVWRPPQYMHMSTKPPIGHDWLRKYASDVQHGYVVHDGTKRGIPRAYIKMLNKWNPELVAEIMKKNET